MPFLQGNIEAIECAIKGAGSGPRELVRTNSVGNLCRTSSTQFPGAHSTSLGANHRISTNMQRRLYGHATNVEIHPLNEEKAVQAAADLLGEFFVFSVAGVVVVFEVQRSSRSEARKEELQKAELVAMKEKEDDLARELELLKQKINELEQLAHGRGLSGILKFRHSQPTEQNQPTAAA